MSLLLNVKVNEPPRNCYLCPSGHIIGGSWEKNGNPDFPDVYCDWLELANDRKLRTRIISGKKIMSAPCPGGIMEPGLKEYRHPDCPLRAVEEGPDR